MERRIDEFPWHCGPHRCDCESDCDSATGWRYAVVGRDFAYSLTVSRAAGAFHLHRAFVAENEDGVFGACDLLGGRGCIFQTPTAIVVAPPPGVTVSEALMFWGQHAVQGQHDQPPKFWRELERRARVAAKVAKAERYHATRCPRCMGSGMIVLKPRKAKEST